VYAIDPTAKNYLRVQRTGGEEEHPTQKNTSHCPKLLTRRWGEALPEQDVARKVASLARPSRVLNVATEQPLP
jgi:hypothetical protein